MFWSQLVKISIVGDGAEAFIKKVVEIELDRTHVKQLNFITVILQKLLLHHYWSNFIEILTNYEAKVEKYSGACKITTAFLLFEICQFDFFLQHPV